MSVPFDPTILTRRTTADLSSSEYLLVVPDGDDDLALAGAGAAVLGALSNNVGDGSGSDAVYVSVQIGGIIKVKTAETMVAGQLATSNGSGLAVIADTADDYFFGIALESHTSGDIGTFLYAPGGQIN